jgi:hypothetical protein
MAEKFGELLELATFIAAPSHSILMQPTTPNTLMELMNM